ncbi:MAG: hypothetical protein M1830_002792 [Pleopsidium flavum]|nr:MAG: hypothetical protein M1830_002792 [Pleopsidium flavum]
MAGTAENPFTEPEKLFLLAEILKDAQVPPAVLLRIIKDTGIQPRWTEIPLPAGANPLKLPSGERDFDTFECRSVKSCQAAFKELSSASSSGSVRRHLASSSHESSPSNPKKRPAPSSADSPATAARAIKPRPAFIASINGENDPFFQNTAAETGGEPPKKKRGRPSKVELQQRVAEAAARGEIYPSPKTSAQKKDKVGNVLTGAPGRIGAAGGAPIAMMVSPTDAVIYSASSTPKKRGRPAKAVADAKKIALEATATAAGQIKGEMEPAQEVVKETQQSEFAAPESLLAGMEEHAIHAEADQDVHMKEAEILESSGTLHAFSGMTEDQ